MTRRIVIALVALLASYNAAHAGGTIRGFVLLPAEGRVALVDTGAGRVLRTVPVPTGAGAQVASIDGSRLLVANERRGLVTELNGITGRRVRSFSGLGRPLDVVLVPRTGAGYVRPRYAIVLDARGWLRVLDLDRGKVVEGLAIARPTHVALAADQLWVTSAGSRQVTQIEAGVPGKLRVVARVRAEGAPVGIAPDPGGLGDAYLATADGTVEEIDAVTLQPRVLRRLSGHASQILTGYGGVVWVAEANGRVVGIRTGDGTTTSVMHVRAGSRVAIVGGWLAVIRAGSLRMLALGTSRDGAATALPGEARSFSYAVLP